ncbi:Transcription factor iiia [Balamuthia mandrillaris]
MTVDQPDAKAEAPKDVAPTLPGPQEEKAEEQEQQGEAPKFVCTFCQTQYSSKGGLRRHVSQKHNPKRTFKCEFPGCQSSFVSQANLTSHLKTHEENRSVVCEHCKQEFKSSVGLRIHHKRHGNPGECIGKGKRKRRTGEKEKENSSENGQQNSKKIKPTGSGTMEHHEVENLSRTLQPEQPFTTTGAEPKQEPPPTTPASTEITASTTLTNTEVITMATPSVPTTPTTVTKAFQQLTTAVFTAITPTTLTPIAPVLSPTTSIPASTLLSPTPIATGTAPPPTPISTSALLSLPQTPTVPVPTTSTKTATELPKPPHSFNEKFAKRFEPTDVSSPVADIPPTPLASPTEMAGRKEYVVETPPSLWFIPKSWAFAYPASFYLSC